MFNMDRARNKAKVSVSKYAVKTRSSVVVPQLRSICKDKGLIVKDKLGLTSTGHSAIYKALDAHGCQFNGPEAWRELHVTDKRMVSTAAASYAQKQSDAHYSVRNFRNVVPLYQHFENNDYVISVVDHPELCSVQEYCTNQHSGVDESMARDLTQILVKLGIKCREEGVLLRHLDWANVYFDKVDGLVVSDFAYAAQESLIRKAQVKNPRWPQPPEVATYKSLSSTTVDGEAISVWNIGVLLYVLLTGRLPNQANNSSQKLILDFPSHVSIDAKKLIRRMLHPLAIKRVTLIELVLNPWVMASSDPFCTTNETIAGSSTFQRLVAAPVDKTPKPPAQRQKQKSAPALRRKEQLKERFTKSANTAVDTRKLSKTTSDARRDSIQMIYGHREGPKRTSTTAAKTAKATPSRASSPAQQKGTKRAAAKSAKTTASQTGSHVQQKKKCRPDGFGVPSVPLYMSEENVEYFNVPGLDEHENMMDRCSKWVNSLPSKWPVRRRIH